LKVASAILILCVGALLALGMVMLYSSSMVQRGGQYLVLQLRWGAIGLAICIAAAFMDYRWLKRLSWPLFLISLALLVLVLVPGIGTYRNGSRRWFTIPGVSSFEPSEAAKLALVVILAWYGEKFHVQMKGFKRGFIYPGLLIAPVLGLIFAEPDVGTTMLLASISALVLLLAGTRWWYLVGSGVLLALALGAFLMSNDVRRKRVEAWLHPQNAENSTGYQAHQAKIALGAGGVTGLGLGNGRQKLGFVPEHHTDFIFSIIGEELGLVATMGILLGFGLFLWTGVYIAWKASDIFGFLLAAGITFLISLQAFINIGVVTSALPNKGLPLPFISYGGSSLIFMLGCVGILLSISRRAAVGEQRGAGVGAAQLA
jgi:cell division protein FtsW